MVVNTSNSSAFPSRPGPAVVRTLAGMVCLLLVNACGAGTDQEPERPAGPVHDPGPSVAAAKLPAVGADFVDHEVVIPGTDIRFTMVAIPGGEFVMGSGEGERGRQPEEGPTRRVRVMPFWIGKHEVRWQEYEQWASSLELRRRPEGHKKTLQDQQADAVSRPTPPYTDMTFGMGHEDHPAICMTQKAAMTYCEWLSARTGHFFRLPTEAEWEYACRGGTTTAFSFGEDEALLRDHGWFLDNSDDRYQKVGLKKPNPFGLHDMHGNVAEWVLDGYEPYPAAQELVVDPVHRNHRPYRHVVRGGSYRHPAHEARSAARRGSEPAWKMRDPQIPQSVWYHTDANFVGFRILRPYHAPGPDGAAAAAAQKRYR